MLAKIEADMRSLQTINSDQISDMMKIYREELEAVTSLPQGTANTCRECKQAVIEIDNRGQHLTGCMTCNIWWSADEEKVRLSEEDLAALHELQRNQTNLRRNNSVSRNGSPAAYCTPNQEHNYCAYRGSNETRSFIGTVPAESLPEISGYESAHNAEDGGENETLGLIGSWSDEFGKNASHKADENCPKNAHALSP